MIRYIPTTGANFALKNQYKKLTPKTEDPKLKLIGNIISGGAAGATSLFLAYPLDVARTRMALDIGGSGQEREFRSFREVF